MAALNLILVLLLSTFCPVRATVVSTLTPTNNGTRTDTRNRTATLAVAGTGSSYAAACSSAIVLYHSAYSSWTSAHQWTSTTIETYGRTSIFERTYYQNATTLCDRHARVTYSPAVSLSTASIIQGGYAESTSTVLGVYNSNYPAASPTCSIMPEDCDPLWDAYRSSMRANRSLVTASPIPMPPCTNRSMALSWASESKILYGCGKCTIYGEGVRLIYFPTSASRDMCASTPTASLTHYGSGAVITAYAGRSQQGDQGANERQTAVANDHTFTSGTAYISIATVSAVDRCTHTFGTPVLDVVLAMPSESVLSLRYSQDHFQRLMETGRQTGYPVSYADFNSPIPWSAWNGQNICDPGGYGGASCSIIYENQFRPQLAIPPEITQLSPDFKDCQLWYNGLWDPPLALTEAQSADVATVPAKSVSDGLAAGTAAPASTQGLPKVPVTAVSDQLGLHSASRTTKLPEATFPADAHPTYTPSRKAWTGSYEVNGKTYRVTGARGQCQIDGATLDAHGPMKTLAPGVLASCESSELILKGSSTISFDLAIQTLRDGGMEVVTNAPISATMTVTIGDGIVTVIQQLDRGLLIINGSTTLIPGDEATTLANDQVLSAASNGLVLAWSATLEEDDVSTVSQEAPKIVGTGTSSSSPSTSSNEAAGTGTTISSGILSGPGPHASASFTGSSMRLLAPWGLYLLMVCSLAIVGG